jgi:hypothetical protein
LGIGFVAAGVHLAVVEHVHGAPPVGGSMMVAVGAFMTFVAIEIYRRVRRMP